MTSFTVADAGNAALLAGIGKSPRDYAPMPGNARSLYGQEPHVIERVADVSGRRLYEAAPPVREISSAETSNFRDALFVGSTYGPLGITVADRIGFDDNRELGEKETGGRAALPIFREIMLRVYQAKLVGPVPRFPREIEDGIDRYLAVQAALQAKGDL